MLKKSKPATFRLISFFTIWCLLIGCNRGVERKHWLYNYKKINENMEPFEVIKLLGKPHSIHSSSDENSNWTNMSYGSRRPIDFGDGGSLIDMKSAQRLEIVFRNDKIWDAHLVKVEDDHEQRTTLVSPHKKNVQKNSAKDVENYYKSGSKDLRLELYNLYKSGSITMEEYVSQLQKIKK